LKLMFAALPAMTLALVAQDAAGAAPCASSAPYGVAARPEPSSALAAQILPAKVGRFAREDIPKTAPVPSNEDFNVTYRSGKDSVFIGLSRPGSDADLKEAVRTSRQDAVSDKSIDRTGELYCIAQAPYFYKIPDFMAWTRGPYFFYADASSPAVLAEFMRVFPY
jgi:hypothetical protein